jgi:tetratricopeptide (TPR) repeat protein
MGGLEGEDRLEEARAHYEAAAGIARDLGDRHLEGIILGNLGGVSHRQGRIDEARALLARGEAHLRETGDPRELAKLLCILVDLHITTGDIGAAVTCLREAEDLASRSGVEPDSEIGRKLARARNSIPASS